METRLNHTKTLADILISHQHVDNQGITFIENNGGKTFISYQSLYQKALKLLGVIQSQHILPGSEIVLQIIKEEQFIIAFWACILGGYIPIPLAVRHTDDNYNKIIQIWNQLKQPYWLTTHQEYSQLEKFCQESGHLIISPVTRRLIQIDQHPADFLGSVVKTHENDPAFIQYSSGSTGDPKGVVLTHQNIIANLEAICERAELTSQDSFLSWQPLTHDMGLIGMHILPLAYALEQHIMSTALFIRKPWLWIENASKYKISVISSPNFGYNLFLKSFDSALNYSWDLSRVRFIVNGAEPIDYKLCMAFLEALRKYGLDSNAMYPVYGLAEAAVGVSFPKLNANTLKYVQVNRDKLSIGAEVEFVNPNEISNYLTLVEVGSPLTDCYIKIFDQEHHELPENKVGRIYIRGRNVTTRYYNNPGQTARILDGDGWLNTGDLGFIHNGQLVITGREKTIIKVNGLSYYPFDIERTALELNEIKPGKIAVCGVYDPLEGQENIYVFLVYRNHLEKFIPVVIKLKQHIHQQLGLLIKEVIPVHSIPVTTSGKIKYHQLIQAFLNHTYSPTIHKIHELLEQHYFLALNPNDSIENIETNIGDFIRRILKNPNISSDSNISEYGIDSFKLQQIQSQLDSMYPSRFKVADFYRITSIHGIASLIYHRINHKIPYRLQYVFRLGQHLTQNLFRLIDYFHTDPDSFFLGAYFYLLRKSSVTDNIKIHVAQTGNIIPCELDFSLINTFEEVISRVQSAQYELTLENMDAGSKLDIPLYAGCQSGPSQSTYPEYGLILTITKIPNNLMVCFDCHKQVFSEENLKFLGESYYNLLQLLISQYEQHHQKNIG